MTSITQLRENAEHMEPSIKELKKSMEQFLYRNTNAKLINVRIWFDGALKIHSTDRIEHNTLVKFLQEYNLYDKGHFIKDEGTLSSIYEFVHENKNFHEKGENDKMNQLIVPDQKENNNEIIIRDADILNINYSFDDKITVATKVASSLKDVIKTQGLSVEIKNKKGQKNEYVTAEGWEVLGTMLGCTPYVEEVVELPKNGHKFMYKATVSIRQGDVVLSRASAIAERNDRQKDRPSVYSMAQTRALGKAYRMALSWIIKMAGYEPTPAEEMPKYSERDMIEARANAEMKQQKKEQRIVPENVVDVEAEEVTGFTTADELEPLDVNPVIVTYAKQVAMEVAKRGLKINKRSMELKAKGCIKRGQIPEEYEEELLSYIELNCPGGD